MTEWKVKLAVSGSITTKKQIVINEEKGFDNPFLTTIKIRSATHGVRIELIARADNQLEANDAAVFFVGQMADILSLRFDLPFYISLKNEQFKTNLTSHVKRIVTTREFKNAFKVSREYGLDRRVYIRALGWYRKAITNEDPIDKFLAFWSSLEGFGSVSARQNERTKQGAINQICDCFDQLWGESAEWKVIPSDAGKINEFQQIRNGIAHGFIPVTIDTIREINEHIPIIKALAHSFLTDWEGRGVTGMD